VPQKPEALPASAIAHFRRSFQVPLTEKEKAFLIDAARESAKEGENWSLAGFIRDAAFAVAKRKLKRDFEE